MPMPLTPEPDVIGDLLAMGNGDRKDDSDAEKKDTSRTKTNKGPKKTMAKAKGGKKDDPKTTKKKGDGDSSMKKPAAVKK